MSFILDFFFRKINRITSLHLKSGFQVSEAGKLKMPSVESHFGNSRESENLAPIFLLTGLDLEPLDPLDHGIPSSVAASPGFATVSVAASPGM